MGDPGGFPIRRHLHAELRARVRIQSDAGVQQYGVLPFPYQASVEGIEVQDVRVTKPNGSVVVTPLDSNSGRDF